MRHLATRIFAASFATLIWTPALSEEYFGEFRSNPRGEFVETGKFKLLEELVFSDPNGFDWKVPAGTEVDGASIPQIFWSVVGGPFEGAYLHASVVHDHFCDIRTRTAHDTHRNFYYGMRAREVPPAKAHLMHWAVRFFGPTWVIEKQPGSSPQPNISDPAVRAVALAKFNAIAKTLETSRGRILDITAKGEVEASVANVEANADYYRRLVAKGSAPATATAFGILAEPVILTEKTLQPWAGNQLPDLKFVPVLGGQGLPANTQPLSAGFTLAGDGWQTLVARQKFLEFQ